MDRNRIISSLEANHSTFINFIKTLDEEQFEQCKEGKWSAGQQLEHIYLSVKPLMQGLILPKFVLKVVFGKANRQSLTYEELVAKYKLKLQAGGQATGRFVPKVVKIEQKEKLIFQLQKTIKKLASQINSFSEQGLDTIILPHPLFGKITLREMMYFTNYHVLHHQEIIKRDLA